MGDLHYYLRDSGNILATRNRGKQVADHLRELSHQVGPEGRVLIDFDGVDIINATFAQELLAACDDCFDERYELANMNADDRDTIEFVRITTARR